MFGLLGPRHSLITEWPAVSIIGDVFAREGLITKRRRRRRTVHPGTDPQHTIGHNNLGAADFKGQFRAGDGNYCYPRTDTKQRPRYLLTWYSLRNVQKIGTKPAFECDFREYGLPHAFRTDHGGPFATRSTHVLSQLNLWRVRLGLWHQRTPSTHSEQNGAHERTHETFKARAISPPRASLPTQQVALRCVLARVGRGAATRQPGGPHTGLRLSHPSSRRYPRRLRAIGYPGHYRVKHIKSGCTLQYGHQMHILATPFEGYDVGLDEVKGDIWLIHLCEVFFARFNKRKHIIGV